MGEDKKNKIIAEEIKHTAFEYDNIEKRDLTILCNNIWQEAQKELLEEFGNILLKKELSNSMKLISLGELYFNKLDELKGGSRE